ncbi:translation initiation factor IF-2 [Lacticaseibacillus saniviri]|uniref:Translation initiation factor IF-2 n=2 Tax=Lacticaseibacillus saniviri TaxID=931533 RepID=A0A0R2MYD8_9LACO|nr:translation initiation factor IF-2 [Lacticaseibacillus saniviri]KRO18638.1 infB protein [Lacticaseibacillus saniviri JCM 17471 = DSM 24301]
MGKKRVYEFAKEINMPSKTVIEAAKKQGIDFKNHMSTMDDTQEKKLRGALNAATKQTTPQPATKPAQHASNGEKTKISRSAIRPAAKSQSTSHAPQGQQSRPQGNSNNRPQNNSNNNNNRSGQSQNSRPQGQSQNRPASQGQSRPQGNSNNRPQNNNNSRPQSNNTSRPQNNNSNNNNSRPQRSNDARPAARTDNRSQGQSQNRSQSSSNNNRYGNNNNNRYGNSNGYNGGNNNRRRNNKKNRRQQSQQPKKVMPARKDRPLPETLIYTVGMNAQDLGKILHREPTELIKKLFMLGVMVNQNQSLDKDTIELLAEDYGIKAEEKVEEDITDIDSVFEAETENTANLVGRPPVVTIMGHVDHGKTTLLDNLRHSHVTEGEAGGITQHIGAYQVKLNDRLITFLDTPGHAAFTNMRARGADITDIIVLVVAADDGVMPQTIEAINHAKAAHAPIIVAVNKIDKPGANPNHVMEQLAEYELIPESWGGDTIFVEISAKFGKNIDELLEMILLESDVLELKANPDQKAVGTVIEARLDKGKGPITTLLVQQGTLHVGDPIVVGNTFGRVRVMTNDRGRRVKEAAPSTPVEITGLNDVPQSADRFVVFDDEKTARAAGEERAKRAIDKERQNTTHVTLDNLFESMRQGQVKEVDVIIKGDVQGSVEALAGSLRKIEVEGVRVNIIHQAVGAINESDVTLASASNAIIIGFNVRPTPQAKIQADSEDVDIRLHRVIYKAIEEIESAMKGLLEPVYEEKVIGSLTVRETINVSKIGTVAGAIVDTGYITRDSGVRLIRDGIVIYEGKLASLRRFKDDVKEVRQGFELGLTIENYNDIKIDDQIEAYTMEEVPVK